MPVRIVLAGILAALCALAGRTAAAALARRKRVLSSALAALEPLKIRMLHRRLPLEAALCESEDALLRLVGEAMPGKTALEAWDAVRIRQTKRGGLLDSLAREDCAALRAFFAQLGESGAREQEALFARTAEELGDAKRAGGQVVRRAHPVIYLAWRFAGRGAGHFGGLNAAEGGGSQWKWI